MSEIMSEWLPIESAPKTGESILCYVPSSGRVIVLRYDTSFDWEPKWRADVHSFVEFAPSHWQPLPEPPK